MFVMSFIKVIKTEQLITITIFKKKNILNNFNTFLCDETRGDCIILIINISFAIKSVT